MSALGWIARARRLVPREDRRILLSPPRLVARFTRFAIARAAGHAGRVHADDLDALDPDLVDLLLDFWRALGARYFRLRVEGVENVPARGPALLVANHNGALVPSDGFFTALAIRDHCGRERRMYTLAHDFLFEDPVLRAYAQRLGMLRAGHDGAHRALAAGHCVLVYPGSDLDTFRPFRDRGKIVLGGRKGFLKLALREGAPIVPVVSVGTHEQLIVLTRGDRIARFTHAHAWARSEVLPIVLSLPWASPRGSSRTCRSPRRRRWRLARRSPGPSSGPPAPTIPRCWRAATRRSRRACRRCSIG